MNTEVNAREYLESVLKPLLAYPEDLRIDVKDDERGTLLTLETNPLDMGRVIGKGGETARSFRRLVRQYGMSRQVKISTKIVDPQKAGGFAADEPAA